MFTSRSRYAGVLDATYRAPNGQQFNYKLLRITPPASGTQAHTVAQGDRLDLIAYQYYGDSEQFWRVCDGNNALWPPDLLQPPGATIQIPNATGS